MILGFSDASISVVKRGGLEVSAQADLCIHIGERVCPEIYRIVPGGYEMEMLEPAPRRGVVQLAEVVQRLRSEVWDRPEFVPHARSPQWLELQRRWCALNAVWLVDSLHRLYPTEPVDGYCLIHGDPALSNLMVRGEYLVLTDPMPRLAYRAEIPNLPEVDCGKLVQSACGWERMLGVESSLWNEPQTLLGMIPEEMRDKAVFWGAVHLARVALRARTKDKQRIADWAASQSQALVRSYL